MDAGRKRKIRWLMIAAALGILAGLALILYPTVMDRINAGKNSAAVSSMTSRYDRYAENADEIERQLASALAYNAQLAGKETEGEVPEYEDQLTFDGNGVMGYLTIGKIDLMMLIYHGTSDASLAAGAGHLEGTSLPVGGESSHCVITAHSGMKTMKAFDRLRELETGDMFTLTVLGTEYVYRIDGIETVLPEETSSLKIYEGEDRVTLVTCTPYGINDHRLLVHAYRVMEED